MKGSHDAVKQPGNHRLVVAAFQIAVSMVLLYHIDDAVRPALQFIFGPLQREIGASRFACQLYFGIDPFQSQGVYRVKGYHPVRETLCHRAQQAAHLFPFKIIEQPSGREYDALIRVEVDFIEPGMVIDVAYHIALILSQGNVFFT